jgi:hypothetical protein
MRSRVPVRPTRRLTALLFALIGLALACGSQDAPAPAPATDEAMPADTADSAETTEPAEARPGGRPVGPDDIAVTEDIVPESYPTDVPIYPDAAPGSAMVVPGLGMFITFITEDDPATVYEHYRAGLGEAGWSLSDAPESGIDAAKEGRTVQVRARPDDSGKTEIAINIDES